MPRLVVSACLLGEPCRYDGRSRSDARVAAITTTTDFVAVCPEELGGLGTPRPAAHLVSGDGEAVWSGTATVRRVADDGDVTGAFKAGAEAAWALAEGAEAAILKARSPSCGCGATTREGAVVAGDGVFAALLRRRGVRVRTDEDL
jgi:uncharacterized protein YbbK (DUF523 family)